MSEKEEQHEARKVALLGKWTFLVVSLVSLVVLVLSLSFFLLGSIIAVI